MKLTEILREIDKFNGKAKIHFALGASEKLEPLYALYRGEFKEWQEKQSQKNFERDFILSLIYFRKDEWLFAGFYKKIDVKKVADGFIYKTELLDIATDLIGRLIIFYEKPYRQSYTYIEKYIDNFEVLEILREKYTVESFPGYKNIKVKFELLKSIISQEENSWKTALSNMKGVYLISDLQTGKLYVGSAYGKEAFWSRWSEYMKNGHGENKCLKKIIKEKGIEYADNFQYTILEAKSMDSEDAEIINRETFWKEILLSREFGYNKN